MTVSVTSGGTKPLEKWSNRDFLFYYSNRQKFLTKRDFVIPPRAWAAFQGRMKGFRAKLNLSNEAYKEFIDKVFSELFIGKQYVPSFGAIVSEKVFFVISRISETGTATLISAPEEFEAARLLLFKDCELFTPLRLQSNFSPVRKLKAEAK